MNKIVSDIITDLTRILIWLVFVITLLTIFSKEVPPPALAFSITALILASESRRKSIEMISKSNEMIKIMIDCTSELRKAVDKGLIESKEDER